MSPIPLGILAASFRQAGFSAVALGFDANPWIQVWPWDAGFGTKYANPSPSLPDQVNGVSFSPENDLIAVAHDGGSFISVYDFSEDGFGIKYANPASPPGDEGLAVDFGYDFGSAVELAVAHRESLSNPSPAIFYFQKGVGFSFKYSSPVPYAADDSRAIRFSLDHQWLFAGDDAKNLRAYQWNPGAGWGGGTYSINASGGIEDIALTPLSPNRFHVVTQASSAHLRNYIISLANGLQLDSAISTSLGGLTGVSFNFQTNDIVVSGAVSPFAKAYDQNYIAYANPSPLPNRADGQVKFSPTGTDVVVGQRAVTFTGVLPVSAYAWSSGWGSKYADPVGILTNTNARTVEFTKP